MSIGRAEPVVIYRGHDPIALDLVEQQLIAFGLQPQRLGRTYPALLGVGNSAIEQLIAVPAEQAAAAQELLEETRIAAESPEAQAALAAEATAHGSYIYADRPRVDRTRVTWVFLAGVVLLLASMLALSTL